MLNFKIVTKQGYLFNIQYFKQKHFDIPWHFHPEYEIVYILSGSGIKYVGENSIFFSAGDLTLIGPNLPHYFIADESFYRDENLYCEWFVIQFDEGVLPKDYKSYDIFTGIAPLLQDSCFGINFNASSIPSLSPDLFVIINNDNSLNKLFLFYTLLIELSKDTNRRLLNNTINIELSIVEDQIIRKIHGYLLHNFRSEITLQKIADYVHMQPTTMCMYYKRHTLRTIFETLVDIRIGYAAKLLVSTYLPIYQIAVESGFFNISNFNRQFLKIKKMPPKEYRFYFSKNNK